MAPAPSPAAVTSLCNREATFSICSSPMGWGTSSLPVLSSAADDSTLGADTASSRSPGERQFSPWGKAVNCIWNFIFSFFLIKACLLRGTQWKLPPWCAQALFDGET